MIKLVHLSDLHFGTERADVLAGLLLDLEKLKPDMIVVSGDLTQRAKHKQFRAAKDFLKAISHDNLLCVPGNHDISLHHLLERFLYPFAKYQQWIQSELCSHLVRDNLAILGINSVTPYKPMGGFVSDKQIKLVRDFFQTQPRDRIKIIVMHHNLIRSERHKIINDAEKLIAIFADCQVNLVLSGHIHSPQIELLKHNVAGHHLYVITAGTAISTRTIAPNSFNMIQFDKGTFKLIVRAWELDQFVETEDRVYQL